MDMEKLTTAERQFIKTLKESIEDLQQIPGFNPHTNLQPMLMVFQQLPQSRDHWWPQTGESLSACLNRIEMELSG